LLLFILKQENLLENNEKQNASFTKNGAAVLLKNA
jgi:hypothetical protein